MEGILQAPPRIYNAKAAYRYLPPAIASSGRSDSAAVPMPSKLISVWSVIPYRSPTRARVIVCLLIKCLNGLSLLEGSWS
jgi:hypothetical protein